MDFNEFKQNMKDAASSLGDSASDLGDKISDSVNDASGRATAYKRFVEVGRDLYATGAVTSHGGNLSESDGSIIHITRSNSMLGHLSLDDIMETSWQPSQSDAGCSRELVVHRAMHDAYLRCTAAGNTPASAVVHAHTRFTIASSLFSNTIVPVDSEGLLTFGKSGVRVVSPAETIGSEEAAHMLAEVIGSGASIAVIKGHGPFAVGHTLRDAQRLVSVLEASCQILAIGKLLS